MMTKRGAWWVGRTATMKVSVTNLAYTCAPVDDRNNPQEWVDRFFPAIAHELRAAVSLTLGYDSGHTGRLVIRPLTKQERLDAAEYDDFVHYVDVYLDEYFYGKRDVAVEA